jgi:amino acid transporter
MLIFIDVTGLIVLIFGIPTIPDPRASFRNVFAGSSHSTYDYAVALLKIMQTYYGWSYPAYVLNEIKDPVRTLKKAGPLGLGTVGLLYILANVAYFSVATPKEIEDSGVTIAALFLGKLFGESARRVAAGFVSLSAFGFVMAHTFSLARVNQELAKEGMLPLSALWAKNWPAGAPTASLLLVFVVTFLNIVAIPFGNYPSVRISNPADLALGDAYNFIMDVMAYPTALMSFAVTLGLFLTRRRVSQKRPFKVWLPLAILFLIAQAFLIVSPFIRPGSGKGDTALPFWLAPLVSVVIVLSGMCFWWVWRIALPYIRKFC